MIAHIILILASIAFIFFTHRFRVITLGLVVIVALLFPFYTDTSQWSWFYWVKTYSVILPIILLTIAQSRAFLELKFIGQYYDSLPQIIRLFLALNIAEGAIYVFTLQQYATAILGAVLVLTTPKLTADESGNIGFDNVIWILAYTYCLSIGIIFYPIDTYFIFPGLMILVLAVLIVFTLQDWHKWFSFRAYSLYFIIAWDSFTTDGEWHIFDYVHSEFFSLEARSNVMLESLFGALSIMIALVLIAQWRKTFTNRANMIDTKGLL